MGSKKKSNKEKNAARNARKKLQKSQSSSSSSTTTLANVTPATTPTSSDVEYVVEDLKVNEAFQGEMFDKFKVDFQEKDDPAEQDKNVKEEAPESDSDEDDSSSKQLSRKQKKLNRLTVAELKQLVSAPEVVETHDVTASDPAFLVHLKSVPNTVAVPAHWSQKRKYLQGKRGIEKPPFALPKFIEDTGIAEIRGAIADKEDESSAKQAGRSRVAPKMGKIDIDYKVLHDAFFKYQTKPKLTKLGDLYYEGKEFEQDVNTFTPGQYSTELKTACGITSDLTPPPWLQNQQRFGPPPSYPNLKIPGVNAPLPSGASFGFHQGGWGKPPCDQYGRGLYGDVFGQSTEKEKASYFYAGDGTVVLVKKWGTRPEPGDDDYESSSEEESSDEEESEESEEEDVTPTEHTGGTTSVSNSTLADGYASVASNLVLRKEAGEETPQLYTVLKTQNRKAGEGEVFGSDITYVLPGKGGTESTVSEIKGDESVISNIGRGKKKSKRKRGEDDDSEEEEEEDGNKKFKF
ncbi:hypothetical protein TrVE_jg1536 [Triparma verrucosa]|uniref:PSP proline-rich domain-containing protein n=1 Tax=Triparma verrucosa TaxID=1606542 RepID=A0A9W7KYA0_9STRA|nr:hypothetical protein TrVE_jg1536 [Triparma verrucosa]